MQRGNVMARVLIADDTLFMRKILGKIMADMGNTVVAEAGNGDEAIEGFVKYHPDLVLLDIVMPSGPRTQNGIDALKLIRKESPEAKVIMISSMGQNTIVQETISAGAKDFIIKPFKPDDVVAVVKKHL
jgi:two-component system chemotaxis response regulator CheY